jgi:hypothetical protein
MICLINFSPALTFKMHAFWCTVMWLMDGLCRCTWMRSMISRFCAQQNSKLVIDLKYELKFHSHKLIRQRWRTVTMIFVLENVVPRVSCWSWCIYIYIYIYICMEARSNFSISWSDVDGPSFQSYVSCTCWFIVPPKFSLKICKLLSNGRPSRKCCVATCYSKESKDINHDRPIIRYGPVCLNFFYFFFVLN